MIIERINAHPGHMKWVRPYTKHHTSQTLLSVFSFFLRLEVLGNDGHLDEQGF
jgi:hypothetical protein